MASKEEIEELDKLMEELTPDVMQQLADWWWTDENNRLMDSLWGPDENKHIMDSLWTPDEIKRFESFLELFSGFLPNLEVIAADMEKPLDEVKNYYNAFVDKAKKNNSQSQGQRNGIKPWTEDEHKVFASRMINRGKANWKLWKNTRV